MSTFEPDVTPAAEPAAWEGTPEFEALANERADAMIAEYFSSDEPGYEPNPDFPDLDAGYQGDLQSMLDARDAHLLASVGQAISPILGVAQAAHDQEQARQQHEQHIATITQVLDEVPGGVDNADGTMNLASELFNGWQQTFGADATPEQLADVAEAAIHEAARRVANESEVDAVARYIRNRDQSTGVYQPAPADRHADAKDEMAVVDRLFPR